MTADTQAHLIQAFDRLLRAVEMDGGLRDAAAQARIALAAALQGRGTQEGEPSDAAGLKPLYSTRAKAKRYDWLRENVLWVNDGKQTKFVFWLDMSIAPDENVREKLDAGLDAALAQAQKDPSRVSVEIREAM